MKILVVGGAGYIGSIMTKRLMDAGHVPVVLDDLSTGNRKAVEGSIVFYEGDLGDTNLLESIFTKEEIELVMHFAAKISVPESMERPDIYYRNNVSKTLNLLDAMIKYKCNKFVFSSTAAVYGNPEYLPIDENHPTNPINPYGKSKRMLERILKDYNSAFGLKCVILRYSNAAGAAIDGSMGESRKVKQNLIPIVLDNLEHDRDTNIFGADWETDDGTCVRDYIHVEDIVVAHLKAVEYIGSGIEYEIFNLGSEKGASVREVIDMVGRVSGKKVKTVVGGRRQGDPATLIASKGDAEKELGWCPIHSELETIVRTAYEWHFNRRY